MSSGLSLKGIGCLIFFDLSGEIMPDHAQNLVYVTLQHQIKSLLLYVFEALINKEIPKGFSF
jgi:hypothetical protein